MMNRADNGALRVIVGRDRDDSNRIVSEWPGDDIDLDTYWQNPTVLSFAGI
jgi:hypothetical protein